MAAPIGSAPLTPEQLAEISVRFEKLTRDFEAVLLKDISRRIAKAGTITDSAEWQLIRMKEMGYANDFIEKAIAEYTGLADEEIKQLFFDAGQCSGDFYSKVYAAAGKPFTPVSDNPYMQQLISAGIEQTKGELRNYTRSMGFMVRQPDGSTAFKPAAKAYQDALDLAQMQVSTGVFDYTTAIRNATKTLADGGLRYVDYATGHVNHADVAVRRAVLTGVSQLTGKIAEHNMTELDTDLVEVSAHAGARPDHALWQGKIYRWKRSGKGVDKSGGSGIINYAKASDVFSNYENNSTKIDFDNVVKMLENSEVGKTALSQLKELDVKPIIDYSRPRNGERGSQQGNVIRLFMQKIPNEKVMAQTIIHETTHLYYGIEQSQWAEAVCFAKEKQFLTGKPLTVAERRYIVKLARDNYPEFKWKRSGY